MNSLWISALSLVLFLTAIALGMIVRQRFEERYFNRETSAVLHATVAMLVTFAAIVLGLLMDSSKDNFSRSDIVLRNYSISLVSLNDALRGLGPAKTAIQKSLTIYTAAAIATTWPGPDANSDAHLSPSFMQSGSGQLQENQTLNDMLSAIGDQISDVPISSRPERQAQAKCLGLVSRIADQRLNLVTSSQVSLSTPFIVMLIFWLFTAFLCLGLSAPANRLSAIVTGLAAVALSSALFVLIALNSLYRNGLFSVSSAPLKNAFAHMTSQQQAPALEP